MRGVVALGSGLRGVVALGSGLRGVVALALVAGAFAAVPGIALAQGTTTSPLSPGLPPSQAATPTTTTPTVTTTSSTASSSTSGLSGTNAIIIAIGALVLLTAISLFIWRDARRRAPVRAGATAAVGDGRRTGSKPRAKGRKLSPAERRRRKRGRAR